MNVLDLSRWQFGIVTIYHFIFVPLTLGLSFLVAGLQTAWFIKKDTAYLRLTKFFGKLFLTDGTNGAPAAAARTGPARRAVLAVAP